jgi:hypothetical protein
MITFRALIPVEPFIDCRRVALWRWTGLPALSRRSVRQGRRGPALECSAAEQADEDFDEEGDQVLHGGRPPRPAWSRCLPTLRPGGGRRFVNQTLCDPLPSAVEVGAHIVVSSFDCSRFLFTGAFNVP